MRKIIFAAMVILIAAGCSGESPVATEEDVSLDRITSGEVLSIADGSHDLGEESLWIVSSIGARLLESKLGDYKYAGLTEADFGRMPDNELTSNLRRLYSDMKPLCD